MRATLRAEPPDGPASRALWTEYQALLSERLDAPVADPEHIFASPSSFSGPGSAWLVAMPSSISNSVPEVMPRACMSWWAGATSKRLCPAMPSCRLARRSG